MKKSLSLVPLICARNILKCEAIVENAGSELAALESAYDVEDRIMLRIRKNELTDKIAEMDALRDRLMSLIAYVCKTSCELPGGGVAEAAKTLTYVIGAYGRVQTMQYDRETGTIRNLCQDLQEKYAEQVETLKLTEAVANLNSANEEFNNLIVNRDESNAGFLKNELAAARIDTDAAYYSFVDVVNSLSILAERADGAEGNPYRQFVEWLNAYIDRLKREALKQRVTNESAEAEVPEEPDMVNPGDGTDPDYPTQPGGGGDTSETEPLQKITINFKGPDNRLLHTIDVPVDYTMTESEYPAPPEGTHWNFTLADLNLAIGMKNPGDTITVRAQA